MCVCKRDEVIVLLPPLAISRLAAARHLVEYEMLRRQPNASYALRLSHLLRCHPLFTNLDFLLPGIAVSDGEDAASSRCHRKPSTAGQPTSEPTTIYTPVKRA